MAYIWRQAIEAESKYVMLQTWNDLSEDSSIMPESNHGWAFFELNKYYSKWYHTGKEPAVEKEKILFFHHPQMASGVKVPEGRMQMVDHNMIKNPDVPVTPPTDYIGVVAFLKAPATISVQLSNTVIAKQDFPAGVHLWLAYKPAQHAVEKKWTDVYPKESNWLSVTVLDKPFTDSYVYLSVHRDNDRIGLFRSQRPIVEAVTCPHCLHHLIGESCHNWFSGFSLACRCQHVPCRD